MTRIEYFNNELSQNKGYEYDMTLIEQMTDEEKCECFNIDLEDIADLPQVIADFYGYTQDADEDGECNEDAGLYHFAFPTEQSFWAYKY